MNSVYRFYVPYAANSVCANVKSILLNIFLVIAYIFTFRQNATAIDPLCVVCMIWCGHCGQLAREWWHYHFGRQHENSMYRCSLWHVCLVVRQQLDLRTKKIKYKIIYMYMAGFLLAVLFLLFFAFVHRAMRNVVPARESLQYIPNSLSTGALLLPSRAYFVPCVWWQPLQIPVKKKE